MRPEGTAGAKPPETVEFVPKRELERVQQENDSLREENERLKRQAERLQQETDRLRRELEAALRASKRQAAPHSRGNPAADPEAAGPESGPRLRPARVPRQAGARG